MKIIIRTFKKYAFSGVLLFVLNISYANNSNGLIKIEGGTMYYQKFGCTGEPILIINGGPGMDSKGFSDLAKKLSINNQTIIYDQRGTGKSTLKKVNSNTVTMALMAKDIEILRKKLKIDSWIILGHSFGGLLASYYSVNYPNSVRKLILSSSGGLDLNFMNYVNNNINKKLSKNDRVALSSISTKIWFGFDSKENLYKKGLILANAYLFNKKYKKVIAKRLTLVNHKINGLVFNDLKKINFNCKNKMQEFSKPTLILQGTEDIINIETAREIHKNIKKSKLVIMEKCAHYGWLDRPDIYFREIKNFLAIN